MILNAQFIMFNTSEFIKYHLGAHITHEHAELLRDLTLGVCALSKRLGALHRQR